jgi:NtrC-family two-component system sensor histidine kinase KinB
MGIRFKILLGFVTLAIMLFIAGIWSIYELNSIGTSIPRMLDENYQSIHAAKKMTEALEREDSAILLLLLGKWDEGRSILASADSLFSTNYRLAYENITIPGEQTHLDTIKLRYQNYKNLWQQPIVGTQKEGSIEWYFASIHTSFLSVKTSVEDLIDLNANTMYQVASNLERRSSRAIMPGIVAVISALVFTLIFNFLVNYFFVGPIIKITDRIRKFKENKTPFDVSIETRDELYYLSNEISDLCTLVSSKESKR